MRDQKLVAFQELDYEYNEGYNAGYNYACQNEYNKGYESGYEYAKSEDWIPKDTPKGIY